MPNNEQVKTSQRLWSEEVGAVEANALPPQREPVWQFSNGRRFYMPDNVFSLPWPEPEGQ